MILRFGALVVILYALGFFLFSITLGVPANPARKADAIIAITGGAGRIERGVELLGKGEGKRLLIAGADPSVTKADLIRRLGGKKRLVNCCVDLGSESVDTRSNAEEAKRWLDRRDYRSLRLITSDWHMRRAAYEFHRVLGDKYQIVEDAVVSEPRFITLFGEYNKYILRRLAVWLDI
ncbi:MAG: YdcF family protein [Sphingomicrobium sp.]